MLAGAGDTLHTLIVNVPRVIQNSNIKVHRALINNNQLRPSYSLQIYCLLVNMLPFGDNL